MNFWSGACVVMVLIILIMILVNRSKTKKISKLETEIDDIRAKMKMEVTSAEVKADARISENETTHEIERKKDEQDQKISEAEQSDNQMDFYNTMIKGFNK